MSFQRDKEKNMLSEELISQLETPCLVIDVDKVRRNIEETQRAVEEAGCRLRPHIKTHKMPLFSRMQLEAGAAGITCAKVSEAEVMADGGCRDIFIAYPMVGKARTERAIALSRRIDRLILAVDSYEGAEMLSRAAADAGVELEVGSGASALHLEAPWSSSDGNLYIQESCPCWQGNR